VPLKKVVRNFYNTARMLMFPPTCLLCKSLTSCVGTVCLGCWCQIRFIERPFCEITGSPFDVEYGEGTISSAAIVKPPSYDRARSAVTYGSQVRKLVQRLKYYDHTDLAPWMAQWMIRAGRDVIEECDVVIPVPLHRWRYFFRQFNQSAEIARALSARIKRPLLPHVLVRVRPTRTQVGLLRSERAENVNNAFDVPLNLRSLIKGKRILLIDDVYTTGATVNSAARTLKNAGATSVNVLTFARVILDDFSKK
jgi:ComF family protein